MAKRKSPAHERPAPDQARDESRSSSREDTREQDVRPPADREDRGEFDPTSRGDEDGEVL